jgi:hypothetical protein
MGKPSTAPPASSGRGVEAVRVAGRRWNEPSGQVINGRQVDEFRKWGSCGKVAVLNPGILPAGDIVARLLGAEAGGRGSWQ